MGGRRISALRGVLMIAVALLSSSISAQPTSLARADGNDCQDHIQPVEDAAGYYAALKTVLLKGAVARAYTIWTPSFTNESAVSLSEKSEGWFVRTASVETPVWRWKDVPGGGVLDFQTDQKVKIIEREFPEDLAKRIVDSWQHVLQRTRAEPKKLNVSDGEGYLFAAAGLEGQDSNLLCGIGRLMVQSAIELDRYAHASSGISRWSLRIRLRKILSRMELDDYDR